jgi:hypothetical protein
MAKSNLPDAYVQEEIEYNYLYLLGATRTTTGNVSWTSTSSTITYNTAGGAYDNQGQYGLMMLIQTAILSYLIVAADFNSKAESSIVLNDMRVISMGGLI